MTTSNQEENMIEIRRWTDGKVLYVAEGAADVRSAVEEAVAADADLGYADLRSADLGSADLRHADLRHANLRYANLGSADLRHADLRSAESADVSPYRINDLLLLMDQPGKIRAYKLTDAEGKGPFSRDITYEVGGAYEVPDANTDANVECGAGINLATLPWCANEWREGFRIFVAEFKASDIAAIPASDGKFRVHRCKIVAEKDLQEIGLVACQKFLKSDARPCPSCGYLKDVGWAA